MIRVQEPVPDLEEVLCIPGVPVIPVDVQGYVTTQEMPAVRSTSHSQFVDNLDVNAQQLVGEDPRRKSLTLWAETQGLYFCETRQGVTGTVPYGAHIPAGTTRTLTHRNSVWIRGDNASQTLISFVLEQWAD